MRVKLYRAQGMAAAMAMIRDELGPEALILATRRLADGVEVTAALEPAEAPAPPVVPAPARDGATRAALLAHHGVPAALGARLTGGTLESALDAALVFAPLPLAPGGGPLLLAGPPGAGKTLTIAKLATRLVLAGRAPVVISADGRRAGAVEQLAAYTRLLGIELLVAGQPAALARALAHPMPDPALPHPATPLPALPHPARPHPARPHPARAGPGGGPALIDAPGLDPFDPAERAELAGLIAAAGAVVALVLPAGLDPMEAADIAAAHAALGARLLVPTRLDRARRLGGVLTAATAGLALAEAGIGPGAADGLAPCTAGLLAARLRASVPRVAAPAGCAPMEPAARPFPPSPGAMLRPWRPPPAPNASGLPQAVFPQAGVSRPKSGPPG